MSVSCVRLESDAYMVCMAHALSTEGEEIMGLCIGDVDSQKVVRIDTVILLTRSDKRKDRVELPPEQLVAAAAEAERLTEVYKKKMRIVGWYHSHPHITVWPSHVDVQTQANYQNMDDGFVGLIFSCFNLNKDTKLGQIQVVCFQSVNQSPEGEAPQFEAHYIPLHTLPSPSVSRANLESLIKLPAILSEEERAAYEKTLEGSNLDMLTHISNGAAYTKSVCRVMEHVTGPLIAALENRLQTNQMKSEALKLEKQQLLQELGALQSNSHT